MVNSKKGDSAAIAINIHLIIEGFFKGGGIVLLPLKIERIANITFAIAIIIDIKVALGPCIWREEGKPK